MEEIKQELLQLADPKYLQYSKKLIFGSLPIFGVPTKEVRRLAQKIKKGDFRTFIADTKPDFYEMQLLMAYVIASSPMKMEERFFYLDRFIPTITDWAVCDGLVCTLKPKQEEKEMLFAYLLKWQNSRKEFEVRFVAVVLMSYLDEKHIGEVLRILQNLYVEKYYAKMGVAWCLATALISFKQEVMDLFKTNRLDPWVQNKAIQKAKESYRISSDLKEELLKYKRSKS